MHRLHDLTASLAYTLLLCVAFILVGCSSGPENAEPSDSGTHPMDAAARLDGGAPGEPDAERAPESRESFCAGAGPAITLPGQETTCAGDIAERIFRYAVCSCGQIQAAGPNFSTDSFDSDEGGGATDSGAPVGANTTFLNQGGVDIGGTLTTGTDATLIGEDVRIGGDLRAGGEVFFQGHTNVARDAVIVGDLDGLGDMVIEGDLTQPADATTSGATVRGATRSADVVVAPPCDCGVDASLDIPAVVMAAQTANDNAVVELDPGDLLHIVNTQRVEIPCGRFYLDGIQSQGDLSIALDGRTALFLGGDLDIQGSITIELGPEAELDLFVAGSLVAAGTTVLGDPARPAATRIYVDGELVLQGGSELVGNVYAPNSDVVSQGDLTIHGALFGNSVGVQGTLAVHYDRAILRVNDDCTTPDPAECMACGDCPDGLACGDEGACLTECTTDADCCDPLICEPRTGECVPILI